MPETKPTHDYIAIDPKCGCVVGLIAIIPGFEKETAKEVADFIKRGCEIEKIARDGDRFKWVCHNLGHHCQPLQPDLFAKETHENETNN